MNSKIIIYILMIVVTFTLGYLANNQETVHTFDKDTLKIGATEFQLDSITSKVIAQLDTFTKPKPMIKWKTKYDTIKGDSILVFPNDTLYPARFYKEDLHIRITGTTYYSLHNQNTFDLEYTIKPRNLSLRTFWVNNRIENRLSENGLEIPFKQHIEYTEYYSYINSLKTPWWKEWYITFPLGVLTTATIVYLVK